MPGGKIIPMTRNFYPATDLMQRKFEIDIKYTVEYSPSTGGGYSFDLNIIGLIL
jgi:hypothetical protein